MKRCVSNQSGIAALVALLLVAMLTLIGLAAVSNSDDEITIAGMFLLHKVSHVGQLER